MSSGRNALGTALLLLSSLLLSACEAHSPQPSAAAPAGETLGRPPVCEASAAVRAPWNPSLVLVADNEISDRLFAFRLDRGVLVDQEPVVLPHTGHPDDIEALAVAGDQVVIFGSHGRSRRCRRRPERERFEVAVWDASTQGLRRVRVVDSGNRWPVPWSSSAECLAALFTQQAPDHAAELCQAIVNAEQTIDPDHCIPPLDIEAAAAIPDQDGVPRVWLGLRRPRVGSRAVLVRMTAGLDEMRWDAVALLEVGDRGLRALTVHQDSVWAVIGPVAGADPRSWLWRAPRSALKAGAVVTGEVMADHLPPAAEGLLIDGDAAVLVTDGAQGASDTSPCDKPAGQVRLRLGSLP